MTRVFKTTYKKYFFKNLIIYIAMINANKKILSDMQFIVTSSPRIYYFR